MLTLLEHKSPHYSPRTYHNASKADLTIAIAANFHTGGELLTHKAAKDKYLALPIENKAVVNARLLYKQLKEREVKILNVAGNGIYTLSKYGYKQDEVNRYVFEILQFIQPHHKLELVISGGQSGIDTAGIVAAMQLGIPAEVCYPKGFKMRFEDGQDVDCDKDFVNDWLQGQVLKLKEGLGNGK